MGAKDLAFLSLAEQAELIQTKEITPTEVVRAYLDRIEGVDGKLNAFITVLGEQALQDAERATADIASGNYLFAQHHDSAVQRRHSGHGPGR